LLGFATYCETLRQLAAYARRMTEAGRLGEIEHSRSGLPHNEYLNQILVASP
jgi:ligand-binding sensor protein